MATQKKSPLAKPLGSETPSRVRINVHIDKSAHEKLLKLCGGEKRMGFWIEEKIQEESRTDNEQRNLDALAALKTVKAALDRALGDTQAK